MILAFGNLRETDRARSGLFSIAVNWAPGARLSKIWPVKAPVPGPNSTTLRAEWIEDVLTMAFASQGEDGQIAPTVVGARIRALKKPNDMAQTLGWHTLERNLKSFFHSRIKTYLLSWADEILQVRLVLPVSGRPYGPRYDD